MPFQLLVITFLLFSYSYLTIYNYFCSIRSTVKGWGMDVWRDKHDRLTIKDVVKMGK
ncbi:MAG: hypothetical protein L6V92_07350 [Phocaeicola vulgatus]|nr:MAG: hypothetical protein L6V92_07350 [Phocaeicola vulgatus]